jgi:hypothetical protein
MPPLGDEFGVIKLNIRGDWGFRGVVRNAEGTFLVSSPKDFHHQPSGVFSRFGPWYSNKSRSLRYLMIISFIHSFILQITYVHTYIHTYLHTYIDITSPT